MLLGRIEKNLRTHKDGQGFREVMGGVAPTIPVRAREDGSGQPVILQRGRGKNNGGEKEIAPTLSANSYQDNNHVVQRTPLKFLKRNQKNIDGDYSFTVDTGNTGGVKVGSSIRRLTPMECERLQGFPDKWTEGISDSQRYKCLGNAVTINVVREIIKKIF